MIIFTDTVNAQVQCYESKWTYTSGLINNRLEWLERGFVALNGWGTVINPTLPILTIHSTKLPEGTHPTLNNIPSSLTFITETFQSGQQTDYFGTSYINFWSVSRDNFNWKTAEIKTIDLLGGNYNEQTRLQNRIVKAGMSFSCAGGPTLTDAMSGTREVFRIINGNMGIGCIDPIVKFEVQPTPGIGSGNKVTIGENNYNPSIRLYRRVGLPCTEDPNHEKAYPWWIEINDDYETTGVWGGLFFKSLEGIGQCSNGSETVETKVAFLRNGNVGIGEVNPRERLVVKGKVCAQEVRVSLNGDPCWWPDYVFDENYNLLSLDEIEKFIKQNKHLPNLPSSEEVAKNGIELGEMNAILLQKIEELTLHLIELKKENAEIKKLIMKE